MRSSFRLKFSFHVVKVLCPPCSLSHSLWGLNMYATLGNIGSIVTQGVVTVSGPFHPFGGAVDIIVVQQEDGSFKCTPWYVKFGKFQGVLNALKRQEKTVVVSVNDVDANLRMYLDHKGEAYFLKEDVEVGAGVSSPSSFPSLADEELGPLAIEYPRTDVAEETPTQASLSVTDHDSEMGVSSKKDAPSENGVGKEIGPIEDGIGRSSSDDEDDDNFGLQEEGRFMGALEDKLQVEATDTKHAMAQFREGIDQVEESVKSFYSSNGLELDNNTTDVVRGLLSQAMHLESTQSPRPTGSLIAKNAWESVSRVVASSTSMASDGSLVVATDSTSNNPVNEGVSIHVNTSPMLEPSDQIDAFYPMLSRDEGYSDGFALKQVEIRKDMVEVDHKEDSSASMVSESINATSKHTEAETKRWVPMREQQSDYASEETISTENGSYIYTMNSMPEARIDIEAACESNSDDQKGQDSTGIYDGNVKLIEDSESFSKKQKLDLEKEAAWKTVVKKAVIALEKAPFKDMSSNSVNNSTDFSSSDRVQKRSWIWWRWQANGSPRPKRVLDRSSTNNHVNDGKTISQNGDKSLDRQISSRGKSSDGHENVVELLDKRWSSGKRATNFENLADTQPASLLVQQENNSRFSYDKSPETLTTCEVDNMGTGNENKSDEIFDTSNIDEDVFKSCVALPELLFGEDEEDQLFGSNEQQPKTMDESAQTESGSIKVDVSEDNPDFSKSRASPIDIPDGKHIQAVSKEYMSQSMPNATNREEQCENFGYVSKLFSNSTGSHFISTQYEERFDAEPSSSNEFGPSSNGVGSLVKDTTEAIVDSLKADQSILSSMNTLDDAKNNSETGLSCEASNLSEHTKLDNVDMHSAANSSFSPDNDMQICTGLELSLCRHLLREGMGAEEAAKVFESAKMSLERFKMLGTSIIANDKLVARVGGKYYASDAAMHIILGMLAFGQVIVPQKGDVIRVEHEASVDIIVKPTAGIPGGWRLWPFVLRRPKVPQQADLPTDVSQQALLIATEAALKQYRRNGYSRRIRKYRTRTNIPTSDQLASLNLKEGNNKITFTFVTRVFGKQQVDARIYLWKWNTRIVISDVDGTITRSDVLGQFMPLVGKDWSQTGVTRLFSAIKENGYELMFLSARAIAQAYLTRQFLLNLKQDGEALPDGPVVISPDGLFPSLYREVIRRAPHEFKIACLQDIRALFPADCNPFYAGFGNRDTDEISYLKVGIPKGKIFIINPKGEIIVNSLDMKSYTSLHKLVDEMFPPYISTEQEVFNSWNFWRVPIPDIEDELTKKSSSTGKKGADLAKKGADSKK